VISADPDEPGLDTVIDFIGDDNLVWLLVVCGRERCVAGKGEANLKP
jgi:hypothetical protein